MSKKLLLAFFFIFSVWLIQSCCGSRTVTHTTTIYTPVYMTLDEIRSGVDITSPRDLISPGKIYIFGRFIFLNEKGEGIHIIDNLQPSNPQFISFIKVPGNGDIAVKGNILYADSYIDLLAFDISNPEAPVLLHRLESIFPNPLDRTDQYLDGDKGMVVEWKMIDTVISYTYSDCDDNILIPDGGYYGNGKGMEMDGSPIRSNSDGATPTGKGGSMARFNIINDYMYSVDRSNLQVFDIQTPSTPKPWSKINLGWDIETIYPFKDKLFIGSMTGMYIYDISTPWNPRYISEFRHASACDPVVADDRYAYVTLRSGNRCNGIQNQLDIIDIGNLLNPKLIKSYPMQEPAGLGIDGSSLFICDGIAGLKVFDRQDPLEFKLLDWKSDLHTYDIIPMGAYALVVGNDGLYQYDYSNPNNLILLSKIPIKK